ncbi:protein translocase subunit SecF, partial [Chlamydiales bacterium]|nr:protein translocase subunit SecF [Chlamydiales bacterium]
EGSEGDSSPRVIAQEALVASGAPSLDVEVRELTHANLLRIQLGQGMEEMNAPFHGMASEIKAEGVLYPYQANPRLTWVVNALESKGMTISDSELLNLSNNWSVMSGQFSDVMRTNATLALLLALSAILIYITLRFEFKYAISAVVGLVHDVFITLGFLAFFHWMGFPVQIDLVVIGAIMTIIGYSLNDTIIVFDRVREDIQLMRKSSFRDVIDHSLNITLSRTLMTSGTTLIVLLSLLIFGGPSIFAFSLVMTLGVLFGTFSSLFIAPAVLNFIEMRSHEKNETSNAKFKKMGA